MLTAEEEKGRGRDLRRWRCIIGEEREESVMRAEGVMVVVARFRTIIVLLHSV